MYDLPSLNLASFKKIYSLIDEIKSEEIRAGRGIKKAKTLLRTKLSQVEKLCKQARSEVLQTMQTGGVMNKYGVDEGPGVVVKLGQESCLIEHCPTCGAVCVRHGTVLLCPTCGSKPFEENSTKRETGE